MCFARVEKSDYNVNKAFYYLKNALESVGLSNKLFAFDTKRKATTENPNEITTRFINVKESDIEDFKNGKEINYSWDNTKTIIKEKFNHIYEVIHSDIRKLYFDIDYKEVPLHKDDFDKKIEFLDKRIRELLGQDLDYTRCVMVRKEADDYIRSSHIHYPNIALHYYNMIELVATLKDGENIIDLDSSVYHKTKQFNITTKLKQTHTNRYFIPYDTDTKETIMNNKKALDIHMNSNDKTYITHYNRTFTINDTTEHIEVDNLNIIDKLIEKLPRSFYDENLLWIRVVKRLMNMSDNDYKRFIKHSGTIKNIDNSPEAIDNFIKNVLPKYSNIRDWGIWTTIQQRYNINFKINDNIQIDFCNWVSKKYLPSVSQNTIYKDIIDNEYKNSMLEPREKINWIDYENIRIKYKQQVIEFLDKNGYDWYGLDLALKNNKETEYRKHAQKYSINEISEIFKNNPNFGLASVNAPCGVGKTYHVERRITDRVKNDRDIKILKITENTALHDSTYKEFVRLYGEDKVGSHKNGEINNLTTKQIIIVSMESCKYRIQKIVGDTTFDYVLLDEYRTYTLHHESDTMIQKFGDEIYTSVMFSKMITECCKKAKNILLLDAHLNLSGIERMELITNKKCLMYQALDNPYKEYVAKLYYENNELTEYMLDCVKHNKKIVICSSTKRDAKILQTNLLLFCKENKINKTILYFSSDKFGEKIITDYADTIEIKCEETNKTYKEISGNKQISKDEFLKNMDDNIIKNCVDILIYTPTFTTGISINLKEYFNKCFVYAYHKHTPVPRSVIQMIFRVRHLLDTKSEIHIGMITGLSFKPAHNGWSIKRAKERHTAELREKYGITELNDIDKIYNQIKLENICETTERDYCYMEALVKQLIQFEITIEPVYTKIKYSNGKLACKAKDICDTEKINNIRGDLIEAEVKTHNDKKYIVKHSHREIITKLRAIELLKIGKMSLDEQEKYYKENNITEKDQIKQINQVNKYYFLKNYTGYFDYRHDPITDNWDIFDMLIESDIYIKTLMKYKYSIQEIVNLSKTNYQRHTEYDSGNQFIDTKEESIIKRKVINDIIDIFGGTNGTFKISNKNFNEVIIKNKNYISQKINGWGKILDVKIKQINEDTDDKKFIDNFKTLLKNIKYFECGYIANTLTTLTKNDNGEISLEYGFKYHKAHTDDKNFIFTYDCPELFLFSNIKILNKNHYPKIVKCDKKKFIKYYDNGDTEVLYKNPFLPKKNNNSIVNNRNKRVRYEKLEPNINLHEYVLNTYTPVKPAIVNYDTKIKLSVFRPNNKKRIKVHISVLSLGQPNIKEPVNNYKQEKEIIIYTKNKYTKDTNEEEEELNPKEFYKYFNENITQIFLEFYKKVKTRFIRIANINDKEYFINPKYAYQKFTKETNISGETILEFNLQKDLVYAINEYNNNDRDKNYSKKYYQIKSNKDENKKYLFSVVYNELYDYIDKECNTNTNDKIYNINSCKNNTEIFIFTF